MTIVPFICLYITEYRISIYRLFIFFFVSVPVAGRVHCNSSQLIGTSALQSFAVGRFQHSSLRYFSMCSLCYHLRPVVLNCLLSTHKRGSSTRWPQTFQRSYYMALKPQRLHQIEETSLLTSGKKPRKMTTVSAMKDSFEKYAEYLNEFNDKRERVVKASRDITINSKKVIFQVHRISKLNRDEVLEKAEKDLAFVTNQYMSRLVKELQGTDFWKLRRAYSPGVQEYIEAATLCKFCKSGTLLDLAEINASLLPLSDPSLKPLQINVLDYLLGVADLTGELMRLAIGRISDGELEYARTICRFARDIYRELTLVVPYMDENAEMKKKMEVMLQSVVKIENACFGVHVRGSEYIPSLGAGDQSFSFFGVPDSIEL